MSFWTSVELWIIKCIYIYICAILCFSSSAHLNFRFLNLNPPGWQPICTRYYTYIESQRLWSLKNKNWICLPFSKFWNLLCKNAPIANSWWFQPFVSNIVQVFCKIDISPPVYDSYSRGCVGGTQLQHAPSCCQLNFQSLVLILICDQILDKQLEFMLEWWFASPDNNVMIRQSRCQRWNEMEQKNT